MVPDAPITILRTGGLDAGSRRPGLRRAGRSAGMPASSAYQNNNTPAWMRDNLRWMLAGKSFAGGLVENMIVAKGRIEDGVCPG
jgi:hypothetical protein